jgi:hypothetical protein
MFRLLFLLLVASVQGFTLTQATFSACTTQRTAQRLRMPLPQQLYMQHRRGQQHSEPLVDVQAAVPADVIAFGGFFSPGRVALMSILFFFVNAGTAVAVAVSHTGEVAQALAFSEVLAKASKSALGGGIAGFAAGLVQVIFLMWMRTLMNYQYAKGTSAREAFETLYKQGGIARLYQGLPFALVQTPLARFGDTAANTGVLALLAMTSPNMPLALSTCIASATGSLWRLAITPIDTVKTTLQVEGEAAMAQIRNKVRCEGLLALYQGALANALASFVGSYPWFFTFQILQRIVPMPAGGVVWLKILRNAGCGFGATCASDSVSNFARVLKTAVQTAPRKIGYREAYHQIVEQDGVFGLLTRGLGTRLFTNGVQSAVFSVIWKLIEEGAGA